MRASAYGEKHGAGTDANGQVSVSVSVRGATCFLGLGHTLKKKRVGGVGGGEENKISKREEWERARRENSAAETIQRTFRRFLAVSLFSK